MTMVQVPSGFDQAGQRRQGPLQPFADRFAPASRGLGGSGGRALLRESFCCLFCHESCRTRFEKLGSGGRALLRESFCGPFCHESWGFDLAKLGNGGRAPLEAFCCPFCHELLVKARLTLRSRLRRQGPLSGPFAVRMATILWEDSLRIGQHE